MRAGLWRSVTVAGGGPGLPRLSELAVESAGPGYRHQPWLRAPGQVAVQVTLAGCGAAWLQTDRAPQLIPRGRALIFRTGSDRLIYGLPPSSGNWRFVYANCGGTAALAMAEDLISAHGHVLAARPEHPAVRALVALDAGRARHGDLLLDPARAARLTCDLLLMLAESAPPLETSGTLAAAALAELGQRLTDSQAIATTARVLGVSREHLSRSFTRAYGESPVSWLRRRRIDQAKVLLADARSSMSEIAAHCGFATASHFVQAFRRLTGVTPGGYRRGLRAASVPGALPGGSAIEASG
jgi:AraC-like DNA-binding protein